MDYSVVVYVLLATSSNHHISCRINLLVLDHVALIIGSIWSRVLPQRIAIRVK